MRSSISAKWPIQIQNYLGFARARRMSFVGFAHARC